MKRLTMAVFVVLFFAQAMAQERKWEHNLFVSAGLQIDSDEDTGSAVVAGYGLGYRLSNNFSLMPCIAVRKDVENMFTPTDGNSDDGVFTFLDIPVVARWHIGRWTLGLGPMFSFTLQNDRYYIDYDLDDPLNGKKRLKTFGVSVHPSVMRQIGRHWRIGVDGNIGLTNMNKSYGMDMGKQHFSHLLLTLGFYL